jgi:hypothetical protein
MFAFGRLPKIADALASCPSSRAPARNQARSNDPKAGGTMTEDKTQPNSNDRHDPAKPEQAAPQPQQTQTSGTVPASQPAPRARKPLFRS